MNKFIECSAGYGSKVYLHSLLSEENVKLEKIVFMDDSAIPEGYEVHSNSWVNQESLYAVLIEEDQMDEIGLEYDLWEEEVLVGPETYFKLAIDFNDNALLKDAKEIIDQQQFHFKLYYSAA